MSIRVSELSFHYGPRPALESVSFQLAAGRFNALLGPNGAGKSTLFALLTRLYALQRGEIEINGHSLRRHPARLMRQLGVVFQQSSLDLDLSVAQNLRYHASLHGLAGAALQRRIEQELARMDLLERLDDKVRNLNGGHRRRLEIARALLHQPSVLLLDEPTVGLDPQTRRSLNRHVRQLCGERQLTVLWATHLIEEIEPEDPVLLLHRGRLRADAPGAAICAANQVNSLAEAFDKLTGPEEAGQREQVA
ncbi:ABC transporter ATP-binding protein [Marinobacterium arenosum]|uniref:ABC transporter ATP-binding protein n=1 Tax=Marinobacterium arenosum TaxID=2862496 RepID=UPI001C982434|nr:ABC transporter ATP-binding protein [Marinobacterium arenosum]MBY4675860.1 ATP-binding cassette domain-containing protein [Marinobacterium arenosum]